MDSAVSFVCAYTGVPGDCQECGGHDATGTGFCSHDCRADRADREARHAAHAQARRDADVAFGRAADLLREQGYTDLEIDDRLIGMP